MRKDMDRFTVAFQSSARWTPLVCKVFFGFIQKQDQLLWASHGFNPVRL
jgi:hypothetical protein